MRVGGHGGLVEPVLAGEHALHLDEVDLAGPLADQQGGHGVAGEVGQGAGLGHEAVDADDDADPVDQVGAVGLQAARQGGQAGAGDPGGALRGDDHEHQEGDLLADGQRAAHRGGDEEGGHGQVDGGAVQVEGVAGRDRDADHGLGDAHVLHLGDEPGQGRLGGGGREDQQVLAAQVLHEPEDVDPRDRLQEPAQDHHDEQDAGEVEGDHQGGHRDDGLDAGLADHTGDRAERPDGGDPHDHDQDPEDQGLDVADGLEHGLAGRAHLLQREAHDERHEQGLQDVALGQGGQQGRGDDAEQEPDGPALPVAVARVRDLVLRALDVQALARVDEVAHHQADAQCHGGHRHEVGQGQAADLADGRRLGDGADAQDDRAEDDGGDHHLDQGDERGADRLERLGELGGQEAQDGAGDDGDDHEDVQVVRPVLLLLLGGRLRVDGVRGDGGHACPPVRVGSAVGWSAGPGIGPM